MYIIVNLIKKSTLKFIKIEHYYDDWLFPTKVLQFKKAFYHQFIYKYP